VLQADGGTRTACICAAFVALHDAIGKLPLTLPPPRTTRQGAGGPPSARYDRSFTSRTRASGSVAAVSVGIVDGQVRLDLDYAADSRAEVDFNIAYTDAGTIRGDPRQRREAAGIRPRADEPDARSCVRAASRS